MLIIYEHLNEKSFVFRFNNTVSPSFFYYYYAATATTTTTTLLGCTVWKSLDALRVKL